MMCALAGDPVQGLGFSTVRDFRTAVDRNRARRRLREAFWSVWSGPAPAVGLAAWAKPEILRADWQTLRSEIEQGLRELNLQVPVQRGRGE